MHDRRAIWRALVLTAAALLAAADTAAAQNNGWRLAGVVRDADGKAIRGATVVAQNLAATPPTQTRTTDDKGRFGLIALMRGQWTLTITAPGYLPARATLMVTRQSPRDTMVVTLDREVDASATPLAGVDVRQLQSRLASAAAAVEKGDPREALAIYDAIAARIPALTSVQLEIGRLSESIGERDRAIAAYEAIIRRAPAHPDAAAAKAALARLQR